MPFDKLVEAIIQEAMARGEFDHLTGRGNPVDLSAYFETPEDVRMAYSILKNAGMIPAEILLLQEIARRREILKTAATEAEKAGLRKVISEKRLRLDLMMEGRRR